MAWSFLPLQTSTETLLLDAVRSKATPGDPASVLRVMDQVGWGERFHHSIGDVKGAILRECIRECKPSIALELGTYVGYSALLIASEMQGLGAGAKPLLVTVEADPATAAVASDILCFAGLTTADGNPAPVRLVRGKSGDEIPKLAAEFPGGFDLVFVDHWKDLYLPDLHLLEELRLVRKGTVVVADNCKAPGAPDFVAYVQSNPRYAVRVVDTRLEYLNHLEDQVLICTALS